jgi:hypothetical protein
MSFKSVQKKIAGQGHSMASAGAILANASRHASSAAKKANPKLKRVKGGVDSISTSSLKGHELSSDRAANLAAKAEFTKGCNCAS